MDRGLSCYIIGREIGVNAIVSAGTVVDRNVSDYTIGKGNPMKKITEFEYLYI